MALCSQVLAVPMTSPPDITQCWNCDGKGRKVGGLTYECRICGVRWTDRAEFFDLDYAEAQALLIAQNTARGWKTRLVDHSKEHVPSPG
jgi:hypothetical protein